MLTLIILGLLACGTLSLLAALFFLYRWISRKSLFPQLPRVWTRERTRFIISLGVFLVCLTGFVATGLMPAQPTAKVAPGYAGERLAPSFDGNPPPTPTPPQETAERPPAPAPTVETAKAEQAVTATETRQSAPTPPQEPTPQERPATAVTAPATESPKPEAKPAEPKVSPPTTTGKTADWKETAAPKPEPADQGRAPDWKTTTPEPPKAAEKAAGQTEPEAAREPKSAPAPKDAKPASPEVEKVAEKPSPAAPKTEKKPPSPSAQKAYAVCAASYRAQSAAREDAKNLMAKGLEVLVVAVDLPQKGRWYRVCVGNFPDSASAQAQGRQWKKEGIMNDPFVVRLR